MGKRERREGRKKKGREGREGWRREKGRSEERVECGSGRRKESWSEGKGVENKNKRG